MPRTRSGGATRTLAKPGPKGYSAYNLHKVQRWRPQTVGGPERAALCFFKYIISPPNRYIDRLRGLIQEIDFYQPDLV
ncbi:MAG: hypothetical protein ACRC8Y_16170 [Chroococcales cyanobacterium]